MRGTLFIVFSLLIMAFGISFKVFDFLIISFAILAFVSIDFASIRKPSAYFRPVITYFEVQRGSRYELVMHFEGKLKNKRVEPLQPFPFSRFVVFKENAEGCGRLILELNPKRTGIYEIEKIGVKIRSLLFERVFYVSVNPPVKFSVYPRSLIEIREVIRHLSRSRGYSIPSRIIGIGEEYAYTDKLRAGDDLKRIDWKKTAKRGELMVKRYYWDIFGESIIVLDLEASDENSADDIAGEALNALKYSFGTGAQLYFYNGEKIMGLSKGFLEGLSYIIGALRKYYPEYNRILDSYEKEIERKIEGSSKEREREEDYEPSSPKIIVVTQLLSNIIPKVKERFIEGLGEGIIIQPSRPWVYIDDIEVSYALRKRYEENLRYAEREGFKVYKSFNELVGGSIGEK
ncbi:MAG: DUF58 domain-containing protein [Caldisphaeraceae archaeon]|nr:DUF58 domain-containing protein [Caldisphaeraceae archaeon]